MHHVSVIIPSYNRRKFLPRALACIKRQKNVKVQVVIVDDGSTDDTKHVVGTLTNTSGLDVLYVYQENGGAASARQTGLAHAVYEFIAFFDSDDLWDDVYLDSLVYKMILNNLDWIYCPTRRIRLSDERLVSENSFYVEGKERDFVSLGERALDDVFLVPEALAVKEQIREGMWFGFQNSVFRRRVFEKLTIPDMRIGEDRLFFIMLLKNKFSGGFILTVMVSCYEHDQNTACHSGLDNIERVYRVYGQLLEGYLSYHKFVDLDKQERQLLNKKIAEISYSFLGVNVIFHKSFFLKSVFNICRSFLYDPGLLASKLSLVRFIKRFLK